MGARATRAVATTVAAISAAAFLAVPGPADAFDTGPHADMTRDAMTAEGFGRAGADVAMVDNWLVDYYTNPDDNPYSGHASAWVGLVRLGLARESWPFQWVEAARRLHFDAERRLPGMPDLSTTAGVEQEWQRLMFLTQKWLRSYSQKNDPLRVLAILGASLHSVQDFYTHSNWVENRSTSRGYGGPAIATLGFGDAPTWFDVPPEVRRTLVGDLEVFTGVKGIPRGHGHWRSNDNRSLIAGLNKDWPGRPKYQEAYATAYFASRQWIRAARTWLGNEPLWQRAMALPYTSALRHDVTGAQEISEHSGHWQGGGEPCLPFKCGVRTGKAGSITSLRIALGDFHDRGPTQYRRAFNEVIGAFREYPTEPPSLPDLPSSRTVQALTRFVKLEIPLYRGIGLGDPVGEADMYANVRIDGQSFASTTINGEDAFIFPRPYAPFTWIRSVPTSKRSSTPVTSMTVRIETGNRNFAGTDDDVHLRLGPNLRFSLDKAAYNDFERGDDDTYSVPIGAATRDGLTIGDIDRVVIEKARDGPAGGWFLHGVTLTVNGRTLLSNRRIDRWLEDRTRTWTAPGLGREHRTADVVGVWIEIKDDDFGTNDTGDINEYDRHTSQPIAYPLGTEQRRLVEGGSRLRGRLPMQNGDRAVLTYRLTTFSFTPPPLPAPSEPPAPTPTPTPQPPPGPDPPAPPPPAPGTSPDLRITELGLRDATVQNQGTADVGAFTLTVAGWGSVRLPGLAAGASTTVQYYNGTVCGGDYRAIVDSGQEIAESDETNNAKELIGVIC